MILHGPLYCSIYNKTHKQDIFSEIIYKPLNLNYKTNAYRDKDNGGIISVGGSLDNSWTALRSSD